jgi:membrane protease YdiL (CAAX protease family)
VAMCLLYERTGSLLPGIALHSFIDVSSFEKALSGNSNIAVFVFILCATILVFGSVLSRSPQPNFDARRTLE